jgi:succinate dehydrogenase / fumarate reductase cytochrome b subunit
MTELLNPPASKRPEFRNINAFLLALALIWAYLHHFTAGIRHIWMDVSHAAVSKEFGRASAWVTLLLGSAVTAVLAAKLFGLY